MIVRTQTGSEYHIDGRSILRCKPGEEPRSYTLISLGDRHVRYTDGELLYVSSKVVTRSA